MPAEQATILRALEGSVFEFPEIPGALDKLDFAGVRAQTMHVSHPLSNLVGLSSLTEETADFVIAQVRDFFAERGQMFGWWLNPSSTPSDLVARLEAAGFVKVLEQAGQVLTDMDREISVNPAVTVRQATEDDRDDLIRLYTEAYPIPDVLARLMAKMVPSLPHGRNYLAFLEDVERPVSVATMFVFPNSTVAVMQGAATLSAYRGKGIYTALMARRLADARALGMEAAVLQADRKTSAPICANLGFKEICSIDLFAWGLG